MHWSRTYVITLALIQILSVGYSHGDLYIMAQLFVPVGDSCACCRTCICEDEAREAPTACQITSAGCAHTNVQTLVSFIKNGGLLPVLCGTVSATTASQSPSDITSIPNPGFRFEIFHPPRG